MNDNNMKKNKIMVADFIPKKLSDEFTTVSNLIKKINPNYDPLLHTSIIRHKYISRRLMDEGEINELKKKVADEKLTEDDIKSAYIGKNFGRGNYIEFANPTEVEKVLDENKFGKKWVKNNVEYARYYPTDPFDVKEIYDKIKNGDLHRSMGLIPPSGTQYDKTIEFDKYLYEQDPFIGENRIIDGKNDHNYIINKYVNDEYKNNPDKIASIIPLFSKITSPQRYSNEFGYTPSPIAIGKCNVRGMKVKCQSKDIESTPDLEEKLIKMNQISYGLRKYMYTKRGMLGSSLTIPFVSNEYNGKDAIEKNGIDKEVSSSKKLLGVTFEKLGTFNVYKNNNGNVYIEMKGLKLPSEREIFYEYNKNDRIVIKYDKPDKVICPIKSISNPFGKEDTKRTESDLKLLLGKYERDIYESVPRLLLMGNMISKKKALSLYNSLFQTCSVDIKER